MAQTERLSIRYYTETEGALLQTWPLGRIWAWILEHKRARRGQEQRHIWIEGIQIHAIFCADGRAWDVINGWRKGNDWLERYENAMLRLPCPMCNWAIQHDFNHDSVHCDNCGYDSRNA